MPSTNDTETMIEPAIEDAVLTRRFDLRGGGHVDVYVWKPVIINASSDHAYGAYVKD